MGRWLSCGGALLWGWLGRPPSCEACARGRVFQRRPGWRRRQPPRDRVGQQRGDVGVGGGVADEEITTDVCVGSWTPSTPITSPPPRGRAGAVPGVRAVTVRGRWTGRSLILDVYGQVDPNVPVSRRQLACRGREMEVSRPDLARRSHSSDLTCRSETHELTFPRVGRSAAGSAAGIP